MAQIVWHDQRMKRQTIQLSQEQLTALEAMAKREGRSRSAIVRDAINRYIASDKGLWPAWIGMIKDDNGSLTSGNVDEWLRESWHP
jgi:predicted transcriptional regulator